MITNDEAMDTVCDAMTFIDTIEVPYPKEASDLVLRLHRTIKWLEVLNEQIAEWESETNESFVPPLNKEEE